MEDFVKLVFFCFTLGVVSSQKLLQDICIEQELDQTKQHYYEKNFANLFKDKNIKVYFETEEFIQQKAQIFCSINFQNGSIDLLNANFQNISNLDSQIMVINLYDEVFENIINFIKQDQNDQLEWIYKEKETSIIELKSQNNVKYVFITKIQPTNKLSEKDSLFLKKTIQNILQMANQLNVQKLAFPILYFGDDNQQYEKVAKLMIIECTAYYWFFQTKNLEVIQILEKDRFKVQTLNDLVKNLELSHIQLDIKYIWQWNKGENYHKLFTNYESYENYLIDNAYALYNIDNSYNELSITFQYDKTPSTHIIHFANKYMEDLELIRPTTIVFNEKEQYFYINNLKVNFVLNNWLIKQQKNNKYTTGIFFKQYKVLFDQNSTIQQNIHTNYKRDVNKIQIVKKDLLQLNQSISKTYYQLSYDLPKKKLISCGPDAEYLQNFSVNLEFHYNSKENQLAIQNTQEQYPVFWDKQNENFLEVELSSNSEEYQYVQKLFNKTYQGTTYAIYRLQNKDHYEKFWLSYQELVKFDEQSEDISSKNEKFKDFWYSQQYRHPENFYKDYQKSINNRLNNNKDNVQGMHLIENLNLIKEHYKPYTIKNDDPEFERFPNKKMILLCKAAPGKVEKIEIDELKIKQRPSSGYDSVSSIIGIDDGAYVYVFYGDAVRLVVPIYLIIFE